MIVQFSKLCINASPIEEMNVLNLGLVSLLQMGPFGDSFIDKNLKNFRLLSTAEKAEKYVIIDSRFAKDVAYVMSYTYAE